MTGRDLLAEGWQPGPIMGAALAVAETLLADHLDRAEVLSRLNRVRLSPADYRNDPLFGSLAQRLIELEQPAPARPRRYVTHPFPPISGAAILSRQHCNNYKTQLAWLSPRRRR